VLFLVKQPPDLILVSLRDAARNGVGIGGAFSRRGFFGSLDGSIAWPEE
jgi:hypothetical protein